MGVLWISRFMIGVCKVYTIWVPSMTRMPAKSKGLPKRGSWKTPLPRQRRFNRVQSSTTTKTLTATARAITSVAPAANRDQGLLKLKEETD
jgi:hypothetical protein